MTRSMERNKLFCLLLALLHASAVRAEDCPSQPDQNLNCITDYNQTISCRWIGTNVSERADNACTVLIKKEQGFKYSSSCVLEPLEASRPAIKHCSMMFKKEEIFRSFDKLSIYLSCDPLGKSVFTSYWKPVCHIKLYPPAQLEVNGTTVAWTAQAAKRGSIKAYSAELQWRQKDRPWSEKQVKHTQCDWLCVSELDPDLLTKGQTYEVRVRVRVADHKSIWSDWSAVASWESPVGRPKPPSGDGGFVSLVAAAVAVLAVIMIIILLKKYTSTWVHIVYITKKLSHVPTPEKSFLRDANFQNWTSPHFAIQSVNSFLKADKIVSVEVTSVLDRSSRPPCAPEVAPPLPQQQKKKTGMGTEGSCQSGRSDFSNPMYSQLCPNPPTPAHPLPLPPPPVSSLTPGSLRPCSSDSPYGPVGSESADDIEVEMPLLCFKGISDTREPMVVVSDYEKVEKLSIERVRLQSLDSGVCSGEEISQESIEADSVDVTGDSQNDYGSEGEGKCETGKGGGEEEVDFLKLLGNSGGGSIQVCSDYERIPKSNEVPSMDLDICRPKDDKEQMIQKDIDEPNGFTSLLFPFPGSSNLPCCSLTPTPLNFTGSALSSALPSAIVERISLLSSGGPVEPSSGGYMSVRQEHC